MKQFFKFMFASCLGQALMLVIVFIVLMCMAVSSISSLTSSKSDVKEKPSSLLYAEFNYAIPERTIADEFGLSSIDFQTLEVKDNTGLNDIVENIKAAAGDDNIKGIYLHLSSTMSNMATLEEIRNQLVEFKKSGKFIVTYAENYGQGAYYIASVADNIYLNPNGGIELKGMASQVMFYKHLLEKLEIEMQIVRGPNNKFKSAVEPYFLDKMSASNREQMETLLNSMWGNILVALSEGRNLTVEQVNDAASNLDLLFSAKNAKNLGFVDDVLYEDEVETILCEMLGIAGRDKLNKVSNADYCAIREQRGRGNAKDRVAVVYAVGQIIDGQGNETTIGSETLSKALRDAREDKKVKAIVMRVNSPGGSALASDVIRREVELAAAEKPLIVSMGDYAASGGYWISAHSDFIFADATTLTGSIGVFGTFPNMKGFFNDKLGLTFDAAKTNPNADFGTLTQPLSEAQMKSLQTNVAETYDNFLTLVSGQRGLRKTYVDSIGQGRVWSGTDGLRIGLVDSIGGLQQAVAYAAQRAALDNYKVVEFPKQKDIMSKLLEFSTKSRVSSEIKETVGNETYGRFESMRTLIELEGIQARIPFVMTVN